jgi:hypothetical protein
MSPQFFLNTRPSCDFLLVSMGGRVLGFSLLVFADRLNAIIRNSCRFVTLKLSRNLLRY